MKTPITWWTPYVWKRVSEQALLLRDNEVHLWSYSGHNDKKTAQRLVALYAQLSIEQASWSKGEFGKPYLPEQNLMFNLSHSGDWALLALARHISVGVDIEQHREIAKKSALIHRCFTEDESNLLLSASDENLLRYWTAKEALTKAIGRGLAYGLKRIELVEHSNQALVLSKLDGDAGPASDWQILSFNPDSNHIAALAYADRKPRTIRYFRLIHD
jgi:4'-phosphopantetheinyl transferase